MSVPNFLKRQMVCGEDAHSMSRAPGSVRPSLDQPPPWARKNLAWTAPEEESGCAKWYPPRRMPAFVADS